MQPTCRGRPGGRRCGFRARPRSRRRIGRVCGRFEWNGPWSVQNTGSVQNTVAVRDNNSDIFANVFQGIASSADYADLAEKYLTEEEYDVGTVVSVGGTAEVKAATYGERAVGVVSANPAYMMNSGLEGGTYIALKGRVPVKVQGPVNKGDQLMAFKNGAAGVLQYDVDAWNVFAIALESSDDEGVKLIEALVL